MLDVLRQLSDNKFVAAVAASALIGAVTVGYRWIVERRHRARIYEFLKSSANDGRYTFRTTIAIASAVKLSPERVKSLCHEDPRVRRNAKGAESWVLSDEASKRSIDKRILKVVGAVCFVIALGIAAVFLDRSSRADLLSLTVNGSDDAIVLVKGEFYVYEWNSTGQKYCDFESPFPSSVTLSGRSDVQPGQALYYPTPNRPVVIRVACSDDAGRVIRKEVTVRMAPD